MILEKNQIAAAEAASGKTETQLMELAGKRCADTLLHEYPENDSFLILCGSGNNGGDGFVIARHCLAANRQVAIILMLDDIRTPAEAAGFLPDLWLSGIKRNPVSDDGAALRRDRRLRVRI